MFRKNLTILKQWVKEKNRKPLVIRGARQVGKTWLVREFARLNQLKLIEINFELEPHKKDFFSDNDPKKVLLHLELMQAERVAPEKTVLFLDEVQAFPLMLAKLRWFKEMMPELAVIVAGSLLEFVLEAHEFSMPVGRISYLQVEPLSFEEFLMARNPQMAEFLTDYQGQPIAKPIHQACLSYLQEYTLTGGLPEAVSTWVEEQSLLAVNQKQYDLLTTYRDDFSRYKGRFDADLFDTVFSYLPKAVGQKLIYSKISQDYPASTLKKVIHLMKQAKIIHLVKATAANGLPLAAEVNEKFNKVICLDVGLMGASLGLRLTDLQKIHEIIWSNKGAIAEQLVGQLLRTIEPFYVEPRLYYWQRLKATSNAELDYLIQHQAGIVPIEVKAGTKGSMQSLQVFMGQKKLNKAVRLSLEPPSMLSIDVTSSLGEPAKYQLLCLPIYLTGQLHRLLEQDVGFSKPPA